MRCGRARVKRKAGRSAAKAVDNRRTKYKQEDKTGLLTEQAMLIDPNLGPAPHSIGAETIGEVPDPPV